MASSGPSATTAAVNPSAGADVDDVVGGANGVFVMFNDNDRVAQITQVDKRTEQAFVITLVQADGGLIQHVHHANQPRANLARQTNTLRFTAGERLRRTRERQVVQTDVDEKLQAIANLFQHFRRFAPAVRTASGC